MKKIYLLLFSIFILTNIAGAQEHKVYFTSYPTLTPDGKTVIFSYEGDLWKADINNPAAVRLTAMQGEETNPRVSPDGKWLAFSSNQFGNNDVYVMSLNGGDIKQLTFHDANDVVDSWGWDSKTIYFTSFTVFLNTPKPASCFLVIHGRAIFLRNANATKVLITPISNRTTPKPKRINNTPIGLVKISGHRLIKKEISTLYQTKLTMNITCTLLSMAKKPR